MGIAGMGRTLPPNAAELRNLVRNRTVGMSSSVPSNITTIEDFRSDYFEALSQGSLTGRRLGALFWRLEPWLLFEFTNESEPTIADLTQLLQNPRRVIPAADPQPQAEKIGLGFLRCLSKSSPGMRGRLFLHILSKGIYGIPSHPRSPMIPQAVKVASMSTRLLKENADVLVYAFAQEKKNSAMLDHFGAYLRLVVLPLSMAKRRQRVQNNPLLEGSFMESVARTFGALWMRHLLAPDFDIELATLWGKILGTMFRCVEAGPEHSVYRTPAKDDTRAIAYQILLAMVAVHPPLLDSLLDLFGEVNPHRPSVGYGDTDTSSVARRKMASVTAPLLRSSVHRSIQATPDGIVPAGSAAQFIADVYGNIGAQFVDDPKTFSKMAAPFTRELTA